MRRYRPYADIRADLLADGESVKYFTKKFYADYKAAYDLATKLIEDGTLWDEGQAYVVDNVRLFHCYDNIYNSKFYSKNSCGYCHFLELCGA